VRSSGSPTSNVRRQPSHPPCHQSHRRTSNLHQGAADGIRPQRIPMTTHCAATVLINCSFGLCRWQTYIWSLPHGYRCLPHLRTRWNYSQAMKISHPASGGAVKFGWRDYTAPDDSPLPESVRTRVTWYESDARFQRKAYYVAEVAVILLSAAIPAVAAFGAKATWGALLGAAVVVVGGLRHLCRWGENWIRSSETLVAIQAEIIKWSTGTPPYQDASDASKDLVTRVEALVAGETSRWASTLQSGTGHGQATNPAA
jgi:Protein of unknown function (DUF4231)